MVQLLINNFIFYSKVIDDFVERGRQDTEYVLVDFENGYAYFNSSFGKGRIQVKSSFSGDYPSSKKVFFHTSQFLIMVKGYSVFAEKTPIWMNFDPDKKTFTYKDDIFSINSFEDDDMADSFMEEPTFGQFDLINPERIVFDKLFLGTFKNMRTFLDTDYDRVQYQGAFITKGKVNVMGKAVIYETFLDNPCTLVFTEQALNTIYDLAKIYDFTPDEYEDDTHLPYLTITSDPETNRIYVFEKKSGIELAFNTNSILEAPDTSQERFLESCNHSTRVVVNHRSVVSMVRNIDSLFSKKYNDILKIKLTKNRMHFISDYVGFFSKAIEVEYCSDELVDHEFLVSFDRFKKTITNLRIRSNTQQSETLEVRISPDQYPLMKFSDIEQPLEYVILAKIKLN